MTDYATYLQIEIQENYKAAEKFWEAKIEACTAEWEKSRAYYLAEFGEDFVSFIESEGVKISNPEFEQVLYKIRMASENFDILTVPEGYVGILVDDDGMFKKPLKLLK